MLNSYYAFPATFIICFGEVKICSLLMKISREKLSYIVDSTAAPVAGLSMLSTWIAYEVSTFSAQLPEAGITEGAYEIFFQTLPYR